MIVAIDGPAGAGKSTVARRVARELGLTFLDTGAMYRAITLVVLREGADPRSEEVCGEMARRTDLDFDAEGHVLIDGAAGEPEIRGAEVTRHVSAVSAHRAVRDAVVARQRGVAAGRSGVVAEGRDTTSVVFPEADHKFFLIASPQTRAERRARQLGEPDRLAQHRTDLERRDRLDSTRFHSPLVRPDDATVIDSDDLELDEVVSRIVTAIAHRAG